MVYLWKKKDGDSMYPVYELLILGAAYITFLIISYVILKVVFNRYMHFLHLRSFIQRDAYDQI